MRIIELTDAKDKEKIAFLVNNNFVFYKYNKDNKFGIKTIVQDGNHSNGGWEILEDYNTILSLISKEEELLIKILWKDTGTKIFEILATGTYLNTKDENIFLIQNQIVDILNFHNINYEKIKYIEL